MELCGKKVVFILLHYYFYACYVAAQCRLTIKHRLVTLMMITYMQFMSTFTVHRGKTSRSALAYVVFAHLATDVYRPLSPNVRLRLIGETHAFRPDSINAAEFLLDIRTAIQRIFDIRFCLCPQANYQLCILITIFFRMKYFNYVSKN